jgi:hypothetical protein
MKARNKSLSAVMLLALAIMVNGCNMFEAIDNSVNTTSAGDLISEGYGRLAEADYATALNRFDRALEKSSSDDARRGRASSYAGLAGFNMFSILNSLQNDLAAPNSSAVFFQAAKKITDLDNMNKAVEDMASLSAPTKDDLLFRSLLASVTAAKTIIVKYDTNMNSKLDNPDQINFTTNDKKTKSWEELYSHLGSGYSPYSLEKAYIELADAFDGRGTSWKTISPFASVTKSGTYTQANFNTIEALGDFGRRIKAANIKYGNSVSEFKAAILELDGVN